MSLEVIILAAGQGSRMKSSMPKVLHPLAGKPLVGHVMDAARKVGGDRLHMIVGHGADQVKDAFADKTDVDWALQKEQLGTGHAVQQVLPSLGNSGVALILYGDVPLTSSDTLAKMTELVDDKGMALLTVNMDDPTGYGRIVRDADKVTKIVEHKDATKAERQIQECNTGIMAVSCEHLHQWLPNLSNDNAQQEYYLTDIIEMAVTQGLEVRTVQPEQPEETFGVNNRQQLAHLERWYQNQQAQNLMTNGVTLIDPSRIDVRGHLNAAQDVMIDVNCIFIGDVTLESNVSIGANCIIINSHIKEGAVIEANSIVEDAVVGVQATVGPFARLRPGAELHANTKVGNFVEVKKSVIGEGSKVNHLSYIGDTEIGTGANIGAGTITCNYDGVNKHKTKIGDGAFIGSNSALVAPVEIGNLATVGAGSTIAKDVSDKALAVARGKQFEKKDWPRPTKK